MAHPLGHRPHSFFALEYDDSNDDRRVAEYRIQEAQREWDAVYRALPWLTRLRCHLSGEVTEPVGSSAGEPLKERYCGMTCAQCGGSVLYCGCSSYCEHYHCANPQCTATEQEVLGY